MLIVIWQNMELLTKVIKSIKKYEIRFGNDVDINWFNCQYFNTPGPAQNSRSFAGCSFKCIFFIKQNFL